MRQIIPLNFEWQFGAFEEKHLNLAFDQLKHIDLPHQVVDLPMNHFNESLYEGVFTYVKSFVIDENFKHQLVKIRFEGVAHHAKVYIDQVFIGEHLGGYTPFEFDITSNITFGKVFNIMVICDTHEQPHIPPFGGSMDYLAYGGIYREVSLLIVDPSYIQDAFVETDGSSDLRLHLKTSKNSGQFKIEIFSQEHQEKVSYFKQNYDCVHSNTVLYIHMDHPILWDLDHPFLYDLSITYINGEHQDKKEIKFGIRHIEFKPEGFYLNHRLVKLIGLNRHQSYPYVGYAMPKSAQVEDADQLKYELCCHVVRSSHYPPSSHFLDRADETGLLVIEEIPGWQHIGDDSWQALSIEYLKHMIIRDRNHPSVIMWGTRINESPDHHDFYTETASIAKNLDPSRPTGGVRNIQFSELLEDVYTYNDFSHTGDNPGLAKKKSITKDVPYLVTEHNGHMFPTKSFDREAHRVEHMKRHLNVIHSALNPKHKISGAIGWAMFDYHTHSAFGSGDSVCYHGVLDMFRIPKYASYAYLLNDNQKTFFHVLSTMDIGEYPSGHLPEIFILTSYDAVKMYKNDVYIGTYHKAYERYPHIKHPPIIIDDFIGSSLQRQENMKPKDAEKAKAVFKAIGLHGNKLSLKHKLSMLSLMKKYKLSMDDAVKLFFKYTSGWGSKRSTYRFEAYQDDQLVEQRVIDQSTSYELLLTHNQKAMTHQDTYDVKRYVVKKVNQHDMVAPYASDIFHVRCEGVIELIGPSQRQLFQGQTAFWVRSKTQGMGYIFIENDDNLLIEEVEVI